jgi:hypothetical protein
MPGLFNDLATENLLSALHATAQRLSCVRQYCVSTEMYTKRSIAGIDIPLANNLSSQDRESAKPRELRVLSWKSGLGKS